MKRKYVQLLLNDHDLEFDTWCWGGEPIYRNGKYCGMTTTTGYGFTFKKQVTSFLPICIFKIFSYSINHRINVNVIIVHFSALID